jgi:transposase
LEEQLKKLKQQHQEHVDKHPQLKEQQDLISSIPGIAELTAARLLAELPELARYPSAKQAVAQVGLNPKQHSSGSLSAKTRLSKTGKASLRKALYMPAISAKRHNPLVRELAERLRARGKCEMLIVGAAMRKLVHLAYGVLKTGKPFDPLHPQQVISLNPDKTI